MKRQNLTEESATVCLLLAPVLLMAFPRGLYIKYFTFNIKTIAMEMLALNVLNY